MTQVGILGAGSWAIAVAVLLSDNGHRVNLWEFDSDAAQKLADLRQEPDKLPGIILPDEVGVTNNLAEAVSDADILVFAVPAQVVREVCRYLIETPFDSRVIVSLAKGIEVSSQKRVSEVIAEILDEEYSNRIVVVSGPSHAEEVARNIPTSVVAAGNADEAVVEIQQLLSTPTFRVYASSDLIGVELGGALKNIIALSAGILHGLELGDNTMGALLTRGLAEISRLGVKMGANPETFAGLSGLGDLVTTASSRHSRNRYVGERIGRGEKLNDILSSMTMVAEGVETTRAAVKLADRHGVEMPITEQVYRVLFKGKAPVTAISELMSRELKREVY
ncbi:MAG: NAD(P)-dependent glycerol-3-phosphate dehydrogenase [candidate division Zixibacteria bacterium]|nr:NAD(P)-dependent glycerol-3-phosphate dehydrogenase [candidate division Zixibacteria bacterium]